MPIARFKGVLCCNSEDNNFPATNLLSDANKKWKCETAGLKSAYVTLQFEKPTLITGIDIGNENSAFIEVYVGKNTWPEQNYKNILLISSFMTVMECRNEENPNRVRCFNKNALLPDVCDEKWDLIKVVCSQAYNKRIQYGLAFVKVHTIDDTDCSAPKVHEIAPAMKDASKLKADTALQLPSNSVFAQFRIHSDSSDSDKESGSASALFAKWKNTRHDDDSNGPTLSAAAAIRDSSTSISKLAKQTAITPKAETPASTSKKRFSHSTKDKDDYSKAEVSFNRNRDSLFYDDEDINTSNSKLEKLISKDKERIQREQEEQLAKKKAKNKQSSNNNADHNSSRSHSSSREEKSKRKIEESANKFKAFLDPDVESSVSKDRRTNKDEKSPSKKRGDQQPATADTEKPKTPATKQNSHKRRSPSRDSSHDDSPSKRRKPSPEDKPRTPKQKLYKPFRELLDGVVFVISGIQNPERADIREKGLKMGAKYKGDWEPGCTHLVCAFQNTPKYKQVQGHGKIVKRNWIVDCFQEKKRLPWRRYALDPNEWKGSESEDEIHDSATKPFEASPSMVAPSTSNDTAQEDEKRKESILGMYDLDVPDVTAADGDSDTDIDESSQYQSPAKTQPKINDDKKLDIFDMDTDEDEGANKS